MKSFKQFLNTYEKVFAGFITKGEKKSAYEKVFAGFITKKGKKLKTLKEQYYDTTTHSYKPLTAKDNIKDIHLQKHYNGSNLSHEEFDHIKKYTGDEHTHINESLWLDTSYKPTTAISHLDSALAKNHAPHDLEVHTGVKFNPHELTTHEDGFKHVQTPAFTSCSLSKQIAFNFAHSKKTEPKYSHNLKPVSPKVAELHQKWRTQYNSDHPDSKTHLINLQNQIHKETGHSYAFYRPAHGFGETSIATHERHILKIHVPKNSKGMYVEHMTMNKGEHEFILPRNCKLHIHPTPEVHYHQDGALIHTWNTHLVHDGTSDV